MEPLDREYCYRRAEEELERARASSIARVVQAHYDLAVLYLDRLYGTEGNPRAAASQPGSILNEAAGLS